MPLARSLCSSFYFLPLNGTSLFVNSNRSFATLKDIQLRLKSVKNIEKITKSMKMIASTKLVRAQKAMETGKYFNQITAAPLIAMQTKHVSPLHEQKEGLPKRSQLLIVCSSDRGLCGAIHSSLSKLAKNSIKDSANNDGSVQVVVLGDKARNQISRDYRGNIVMNVSQVGRSIPTFTEASSITNLIWRSSLFGTDANGSSTCLFNAHLLYNKFLSLIAYEATSAPLYSAEDILNSENLKLYDYSDDSMENYTQFLFASNIFGGLIEGHAAEMAAKRTSMENASKNAGEIILGLTMRYNRTRQAVITNELVDIITGASAL